MTAELESRVLRITQKRKQRPLHASEIRARAGVDRTRHDELLAILEGMAGRGLLSKLSGDRYQYTQPAAAPAPEAAKRPPRAVPLPRAEEAARAKAC